jgi:hypothetical protein
MVDRFQEVAQHIFRVVIIDKISHRPKNKAKVKTNLDWAKPIRRKHSTNRKRQPQVGSPAGKKNGISDCVAHSVLF